MEEILPLHPLFAEVFLFPLIVIDPLCSKLTDGLG